MSRHDRERSDRGELAPEHERREPYGLEARRQEPLLLLLTKSPFGPYRERQRVLRRKRAQDLYQGLVGMRIEQEPQAVGGVERRFQVDQAGELRQVAASALASSIEHHGTQPFHAYVCPRDAALRAHERDRAPANRPGS